MIVLHRLPSRPRDVERGAALDSIRGSSAPTALAPLIDPNVHSCGTVPPHGEAELRHPEGDVYVVGMKSYGRAPTFLLAHWLRAGALDRRCARRRCRGGATGWSWCCRRPACAAPTLRCRRVGRLLRRSAPRKTPTPAASQDADGEGGREERLRLRHRAARARCCCRSESLARRDARRARGLGRSASVSCVNWGVLFFAFSVLLVPLQDALRRAAVAGGRRVLPGAAGFRDWRRPRSGGSPIADRVRP